MPREASSREKSSRARPNRVVRTFSRKSRPIRQMQKTMQRASWNVGRGLRSRAAWKGARLDLRDIIINSAAVSVCTLLALSFATSFMEEQEQEALFSDITLKVLTPGEQQSRQSRPLIFFNRPPNTGSPSVHHALANVMTRTGRPSASCFESMNWNEMVMKTVLNRNDVDYYGCRARMPRDRFREVAKRRDGNVTFLTVTRDPTEVILSSYLEENSNRNLLDVKDAGSIRKEVDSFRSYVAKYPFDALYNFHGGSLPIKSCPTNFGHLKAMRMIAERYEVVVDLRRPEESAEMMEIVTGLRPDFTKVKDEDKGMDMTNPMLAALSKVDTSNVNCGNVLVHTVLMQQFNVIKDRLMQNRCFDEPTGSFELCEKAVLLKSEVTERTRMESFRARKELTKIAGTRR